MQSADDLIENFLFVAHGLIFSRKAVLFVDEVPDETTIVSGVRLFIEVHIKILAFIILDFLNMPDPLFDDFITTILPPLGSPLINLLLNSFMPLD